MLSSKIDTLLAFQPPARELLQQKDIHITAKKYYDFFGFTDNAIVFLKRYITENFNFLSYYDQSSVLLIQTCHNFHSAWPKLHKDPSPLISVLLTQLQNTLALASSISPLDFKLEDEARETFSVKVNAVKDVQMSVDKKFQALWKQCHMQTTTYYQKLEEYKEQKERVRQEYEQYEKQTRDSKGYNVTLVQELEAKLNEKTLAFIKTKDAFERVCAESQESYNAVLNFFEANRGLIEDFLKMFMRTLMEMTVFLIERMQQNFMFLKQKTGELHQIIKSLNLKASLEAEENFMKVFCMNPRQQLGQVKEMNRLNYHRQEFVNAMGFFSQESLHICQDAIEKFTYFEEVEIFRDFFAQFDSKIALNLVPFGDFLKELKSLLISLFTHEKTNNEQMTQKLASQRLKAYSALVNALTRSSHRHSHQPSQINLEQDSYHDDAFVKKAFAEFLKTDENLAQDLVKDLDRLYNTMNQEVWTKIIQSCQKVMVGLKDKLKEDKLTVEVQRIQGSLIQALGHTENIETLETKRNAKKVGNVRDRSTSVPEECAVIAEERLETWSNKINKYNRSEFKFITEKKAESLAEYIKRQNEERLKEINPNPYTVEFEKGKMSVSTYSDEAVLDSFACAFVENMLLQGRMYITSTKIVFKSYFNGRTLFGSTMLFVPLKEIIQVEKKKNSLGIENMIEITTRKGNLVFTSFVFRDKAFDLIQKILNTLHPGYARNFNRGQSIPNFGEALDEEFEENMQIEQACSGKKKACKKISKEQRIQFEFMKRQKELKKVMPPVEKYDQVGYKFQYPVDLNTFFRVMLCKSPLTYKGKNYSCCWEIFEEQQNTSDLTVEEWNQELPKDITKKKHLIINNGYFERNCHGTKNLAIPIPFVPKSFRFIQPNKLYLVNEKEAVCVLEVDSKDKIPLSDTFKFRTCYVLRDETGPDGKPMVSMSFNYYVEWFKSTMLKAILLKAAREEITGTGAKLNTVITELIKDGVFEKKKQELAKENCEEESEEEEEEESNGGEGIDIDVNDVVESTETSETRVIKEDEKVVSETVVVGTKQVSEFKVTKRILMIYFSVSLMLCIFIFMRNLYKV